MINFCQDFFKARNLANAVDVATGQGYPAKLNMVYYVNRALVIFVSAQRVVPPNVVNMVTDWLTARDPALI